MQPYKNLRGDSPITGYEIGQSHIDVEFSFGGTYRYSYVTPGEAQVEQMKKLARQGSGLAAFISSNVYGYELPRGPGAVRKAQH
jgi:hypothetical protein